MVDMGLVHGLEKARDIARKKAKETDTKWWECYRQQTALLGNDSYYKIAELSKTMDGLAMAEQYLNETISEINKQIEAAFDLDEEAV